MFAPSDMVSIARFRHARRADARPRTGCRLLCDAVADVFISAPRKRGVFFRGTVATTTPRSTTTPPRLERH